MTKRLRITALFALALALVAALALVGCGGADNAGSKAKEPEKTSEPVKADAVKLQVFAANSLQKALPEVQALYTKQNPEVTFSDTQFEASGTLVNKLAESSTAADILICASTSSMDKAVKNGSIDEATRADMFKNDLVLCAASNSDLKVSDVAELGTNDQITTIAMGEPNAVPAGKYALQTLVAAQLATSETAADGKITYTFDPSVAAKMNDGADKVGTVANYVASGDAQVGFVYTSDIYRYDGIKVIYTIPADMHKAIMYPGAVAKDSDKAEAAKKFLDFCMNDPEAQKIFSQYGFELA